MIDISLHHGDCLEVMKQIPDGSVDMVLCDLPYGTTACKWDTIIPFDLLWPTYLRVCKENAAILLFGSEPFSSYLRLSNIDAYGYDWIWHKSSSGSFANAKRAPMKFHENISVFYRRQPTYNPQFQEYADSVKIKFKEGDMVNRTNALVENHIHGIVSNISGEISHMRGKYPESVQFFKSVPNCNGNKLHPTQKPVSLLSYLIRTYTNEGEIVLDNCMGSGSTGVACIETERNFIGIEKEDKYFNIAKERIAKAQTLPKQQELEL